jgi:hypothetical protein
MLDLRIPSGYFFLLLGIILIGVSFTMPSARAPLTEVNVNLYSGLAMAVFGGILLWLARRSS